MPQYNTLNLQFSNSQIYKLINKYGEQTMALK